jgi:hypothetical protein
LLTSKAIASATKRLIRLLGRDVIMTELIIGISQPIVVCGSRLEQYRLIPTVYAVWANSRTESVNALGRLWRVLNWRCVCAFLGDHGHIR